MTDKELFDRCKREAPAQDLARYLEGAYRLLSDFHLPAPAVRAIADMAVLAEHLRAVAYKPAHKAQAWDLIYRYKSAVPCWWKGIPPTRRADGRRRWVGHRVTHLAQRRAVLTLAEARAIAAATLPDALARPVGVLPRAAKPPKAAPVVVARPAPGTLCPHCQCRVPPAAPAPSSAAARTYRYRWAASKTLPAFDGTIAATSETRARAAIRARHNLPWCPVGMTIEALAS